VTIGGQRDHAAPAATEETPGGAAAEASVPASARRPWWIWVAPFAALLAVLCARNRFLFTARIYEHGDAGANSILIQQAMHFTLLVGNYSREGFNHPGPAYMYVQAFGQWAFYYGLHVVPTAWNAHMLAVFILNSALAAMAVAIVYGWTGSLRGAAACLAVILALAAVNPPAINSDWNPYLYVPTFCVFLIAAASLSAGHSRDAWILALTGWFLIHGQACFLFIVPVILFAVLVILIVRHRHAPLAALRRLFRERRGAWIPVLAISAVFASPIVVNLVLNWPGDFARYISYGNSRQAGGHTAGQITQYALWFWWPRANPGVVAGVLFAVALAVALGLARGPLRRFLLALLGINLVSSLAFGAYVATGVDFLNQYYIGYFYWSAPMVTLLVIAVGLAQAFRRRWATATATAVSVTAMVAALVAVALRPGTLTSTEDTDPGLPHAVAMLASRAPGRTLVLAIDHSTWIDTTGFLVQAERTHVRACVTAPWWTFMMTRQFICTPRQITTGARFWFDSPKPPPAAKVLFRFGHTDVAAEAH
jgi:hypothetical protein